MDTRKKKSSSPGKGRPVEKRHKAQRPQQNAVRREPQPAARNPQQPQRQLLRSSAAGLTEHTGRQQSIAMSAASGAESAEQIS